MAEGSPGGSPSAPSGPPTSSPAASAPVLDVLALGFVALRHDCIRLTATIDALVLGEGWQLHNLIAFWKIWSEKIVVDFYRQQELFFFPALAKAVPDASEAILNLVQQHKEVKAGCLSISAQLHDMATDIGGGSPTQLSKLKESFRTGIAAAVRDQVLFAEENVIPQWKALPSAVREATELTLASGKGWKHPAYTLPWLTAQVHELQFESSVLPQLGASWPLPAKLVRSFAVKLWRPRWHGRIMPLLVSVYCLKLSLGITPPVKSPHEAHPKSVPAFWCCADPSAVAAFPPAPITPATPATAEHPIPQPAVFDEVTSALLAEQASAGLPALGAAWRQAADLPVMREAVLEENRRYAANVAANALSANGKHLSGPRNSFSNKSGSNDRGSGSSTKSLSLRARDSGSSSATSEKAGADDALKAATASTDHTTTSRWTLERERTGTGPGLPPPLSSPTDVTKSLAEKISPRPVILTGPAAGLPSSGSSGAADAGGGVGGGSAASPHSASSTSGALNGGSGLSPKSPGPNPRDLQVHGIEDRDAKPLVLAAPPGVSPEHSNANSLAPTAAAPAGAGGDSLGDERVSAHTERKDDVVIIGEESPHVGGGGGGNTNNGAGSGLMLVRSSANNGNNPNPNNETFRTVPAPSESPQPGLTAADLPGAVTAGSTAPTAGEVEPAT